jgi:hypothetical protein
LPCNIVFLHLYNQDYQGAKQLFIFEGHSPSNGSTTILFIIQFLLLLGFGIPLLSNDEFLLQPRTFKGGENKAYVRVQFFEGSESTKRTIHTSSFPPPIVTQHQQFLYPWGPPVVLLNEPFPELPYHPGVLQELNREAEQGWPNSV